MISLLLTSNSIQIPYEGDTPAVTVSDYASVNDFLVPKTKRLCKENRLGPE